MFGTKIVKFSGPVYCPLNIQTEDTYRSRYTGRTQKNGAVLMVFTIKTAPFFCVCPV